MSSTDDFAQWEQEVAEPAESSNVKGMAVAGLILVTGSGMLIGFGAIVPGVTALAILSLIVFLWWVGL